MPKSKHDRDRPFSLGKDSVLVIPSINIIKACEIFVLLLVVAGIEAAEILPAQFQPLSLFWIPVILSTLLHGTIAGLVTAGLATGLNCALIWSDPLAHPDYYSHLLDNLWEPILWLLLVGVLGPIRQRQIDELHDLREQAGDKQQQALALAERCQSLRQEIALLEHTIAVSGPANAGHSVKLLENLAVASPDRLAESFRDALNRLLGAEGVEILVLTAGEWVPFDRTGAKRLPYLTAPSPGRCPSLLEAILNERRMLSCAYSADAEALSGDAAMAAPLFDGRGDLLGAVLIRRVDPACLSAAGEAALSLSCFILGMQLSACTRYRAREPLDFTVARGAPRTDGDRYGSGEPVGAKGV